MKKVQYYLGDPFKFHKKVVDSKHKGPQKKRVEALKINIEKSYKEYNKKFKNNQLVTLKPIALQPNEQEALKGLYRFRAKSLIAVNLITIFQRLSFQNFLQTLVI